MPFDPANIELGSRPAEPARVQGCVACDNERQHDAEALPSCSFCDPDFERWLMAPSGFGLSRVESH